MELMNNKKVNTGLVSLDIVAGLNAKGITEITKIEHILRGYEKIVDKLNKKVVDR